MTEREAAQVTAACIAEAFYKAFANGDSGAMQACYHPEAQFTDPVFKLQGPQVGNMWRMLTAKARDMRLEYEIVSADDQHAEVRWESWYLNSASGRKVHNQVQTLLEIRDGLIWRHEDYFDFWFWSQQALGASGWILGWTNWLQQQVHMQAMNALESWKSTQLGEPYKQAATN